MSTAIHKARRGLDYRDIHRIADAKESAMKSQLRLALRVLSEALTLQAIERTALTFDADGLVRQLPWTEFQARINATTGILREVLRESGDASFASIFPEAQALGAGFNVTNPAAVQFIAERGAQLVTAVTEETRLALREGIRRAYTQGGGGPREVARTLRPMVGLDRVQARALANFTDGLRVDGRLNQRSLQQVEAYGKRLLKVRTERIARTELLTASNAGQYQTVAQAIERGLVSPGRVRIAWLTTPDDRLCQICAGLNGVTVGYQEEFRSELNRPIAGPTVYTARFPPIHVQCRCTTTLEFI